MTGSSSEPAEAIPAVADGDLDLPLRVPEAGVTEIVVHGVGGASPPAMLGEATVEQVTGDRVAGMWRGTDRDAAQAGDRRWHREAYSWGGLTSRAATDALWLILTPFALLNLAGWMALGRGQNTDTRRPDWRVAYQQALVRVLGLMATLTYIIFVSEIAMDFGTWQCTQVDDCRLHDWPSGVSPALAGYPARAVVLAAVVPLLGVAALHLLSRHTVQLYEDYGSENGSAGGSAGRTVLMPGDRPRMDPVTARLTDRRFWIGGYGYADRSRVLHLMSAILLVATLMLAVAEQGGRWPAAARALIWATAVGMTLAAVCVGWQRARRWLDRAVWRIVAWVVTWALLVAAAVLAWLQPPPPEGTAHSAMPGQLEMFDAVVLAVLFLSLVHAAVAVSGRIAARGGGHRPLPAIPAPFIVVTVGNCLLYAVWSGIALGAAQWLSPSATPQADLAGVDHLVYPSPIQVLAKATVVAATLIAVVMAVILGAGWIRRRPNLNEETTEWNRYHLPGWNEASERWQTGVRFSKWTTGLARWIELALSLVSILAFAGGTLYALWFTQRWVGWAGTAWVVGAVVAFGGGLTVLAWLSIRTRPQPASTGRRSFRDRMWVLGGLIVFGIGLTAACLVLVPLADRFGDRTATPFDAPTWLPGAGLSSALLAAVPIGAILLMRRAIQDRNTRRVVGAAWDVTTFWPRTFHPLAPPSYAERAVPELTHRVRELLEGRHAVLLLGHSQGAVLTAATLAQLTDVRPDDRRRLSVITYGNPLANLYMRWFPRYIHDELIDAVRGATTSTTDDPTPPGDVPVVNYFRHTDPVGRGLYRSTAPAPSASPHTPLAEDRWLPDPPINRYRTGNGEPQTRGHAHAGYVRQSHFADYIVAEVKRLNETPD